MAPSASDPREVRRVHRWFVFLELAVFSATVRMDPGVTSSKDN